MISTLEIKRALKAAKELGYPKSVLEKIKKCKNDVELNKVMREARLSNNW